MKSMWMDITLVSLYKSEKEHKALSKMEKYCEKVIPVYQPIWLSILQCGFGLISTLPLRSAYCFSFTMRRKLKELARGDFDMIYIKRLRMAQYSGLFSSQRSKVFVDLTDSMTKFYENLVKVTSGVRKILAIEELFKITRYEKKVCKREKNLVICSKEDKEYINKKFGISVTNITVLENGIDSKYRKFSNKELKTAGKRHKLVFWGVMNVDTNHLSVKDFLENYFIHLPSSYSITIIGPKPSEDLLKYASKRVIFKWFVEDIHRELQKYDIFVNPIVSWAWVKNKVIQSGAFWLPILSTVLWVDGIVPEIKSSLFVYSDLESFLSHLENIQKMNIWELSKRIKLISDKVISHYDSWNILKKFVQKLCIK